MQNSAYRALIVDDEPDVRHLAVRTLTSEGFRCDAASDGGEAMRQVERWRYDLVVTDLRMPRRHGQALAVDLLNLDHRPLVVVLTGACDTKLVRDLVALGVDDLMFKPVNYGAFAAKMKALVERRETLATEQHGGVETVSTPDNNELLVQEPECPLDEAKIDLGEIEQKLEQVSTILPVSQAALRVFEMTNQGGHSDEQVSAAVERDPSLTMELLRLANNSAYNSRGEKIVDTTTAIARVGQRRVGEMALASSTLAAVTPGMFPWMDMELSWQRSIAAGVAVELLVAEGELAGQGEDLFSSTTMHGLGRVILGSLYPQVYRRLIKNCHEHDLALQEEERVFPENHARILSRLLSVWNIPSEVSEPLKYILDDYLSLTRLSEPLREKVELIKLAILIGQIVVEGWESWDLVEIPPPEVLDRLGVHEVAAVIEQAESAFKMILKLQPRTQALRDTGRTFLRPKVTSRQIAYYNLSPHRFDFLAAMLPTMGIELDTHQFDLGETGEPVLVNCLGAHPSCLEARIGFDKCSELTIIADEANAGSFDKFGNVISLPTSYSKIRAVCHEASCKVETTKVGTNDSGGRDILYDCKGIRNLHI